jgi:hypothetical protein
MKSRLLLLIAFTLFVGNTAFGQSSVDIVPKQLESDCSHLQTGKFEVTTADGSSILVERTLEKQIEEIGGKKIHFNLEWTASCNYKLSIHELHRVRTSRDRRPIRVRIDKVEGNQYSYFITKNGRDWEFGGEARKVGDVKVTSKLN